MMHSTRIPDDSRQSSAGNQNLDEILERYFRAALPEHWPDCPQSAVTVHAAPAWPHFKNVLSHRRLALVAATLGLIVGYHALLGSLPDPQLPSGLKVDSTQPLGMRLMPGKFIDLKLDGKPAAVDADLDPKKVIPKK